MTNINAGELRHRCVVQKQSSEKGLRGEKTGEWITTGKLWAKITPLWGRELEAAHRRQSNISMRIITRNKVATGLDHTYRILHKCKVYHVGWVQEGNDEEHEDWHIMVSSDNE